MEKENIERFIASSFYSHIENNSTSTSNSLKELLIQENKEISEIILELISKNEITLLISFLQKFQAYLSDISLFFQSQKIFEVLSYCKKKNHKFFFFFSNFFFFLSICSFLFSSFHFLRFLC